MSEGLAASDACYPWELDPLDFCLRFVPLDLAESSELLDCWVDNKLLGTKLESFRLNLIYYLFMLEIKRLHVKDRK